MKERHIKLCIAPVTDRARSAEHDGCPAIREPEEPVKIWT